MGSENFRHERLTDSRTWSASAELAGLDLPRKGLITEVQIHANVTVTLAATAVSDYWRRIFQSVKIEGGSKTFLGLSGGDQMSRVLALWHETKHGTPTLHSNGAGIALATPDVASTTHRSSFIFHPGSNPSDPFDMSAVIPARALSDLQVKLTTTANGVMDTGANITAGTFNFEVSQVLGLTTPRGIMVPYGYSHQYAHTANISDYGYDIDIPGGKYLRSILIMVQDDTGTVPRRKSDEVTGIAIKRPKVGDDLIRWNIYDAQLHTASRFGLRGIAGEVGPIGAIADLRPGPSDLQSMCPAGWVMIDMRQFGHPVWGLDLRNFQTGDYKLGLTVENYASGDDTYIYWDQLLPADEAWVGR